MGTRQYADDDSAAKQQRKKAKVATTTSSSLGVRINGMQVSCGGKIAPGPTGGLLEKLLVNLAVTGTARSSMGSYYVMVYVIFWWSFV